jgi:hypothetical protein
MNGRRAVFAQHAASEALKTDSTDRLTASL